MIYSYGISAQGTYHIKNNNIPCQDYHHIVKCGNDVVVAAVADGLGSVKYSDVGSKIAATVSVNCCAEKVVHLSDTDAVLGAIKESFVLAQNSIEKEAKDKGHSINDYDTTLTLAIMCDDTLYYGHSGDSGIIALTVEGLYEQVTKQQRDEDGCVFPLFFKEKWIFRRYGKKVCSVLLATDGIFETFFPFLLKEKPINIHVMLAQFFMDNKMLHIDELGEEKIKTKMEDFIFNIPDEQVNDDKTIVVMVNSSIESSLQPKEYYIEPDWDDLKKKHDEEWKRKAYPHLFKDKNIEVSNNSVSLDKAQIGGHVEETPAKTEKQDTLVKTTEKTDVIEKKPTEPRRKGIIKKAIEAIIRKQ
jgi:serine/threonine protein phosphatase PrpC